jgi:serine/threonine-protein kinase RsbW
MVLAKNATVEVRLPSRLGFEKVAMGTAASVARLMGFSEDRVEDLKTAIAEACINAMEHGNKFDESLPVGVVLTMSDATLEVKVVDKGPGPDRPIPLPDIDRKMHGDEPPRGLGMFLIQSLVDEVEWVRGAADGGSYMRLVIRLDKAATGQSEQIRNADGN